MPVRPDIPPQGRVTVKTGTAVTIRTVTRTSDVVQCYGKGKKKKRTKTVTTQQKYEVVKVGKVRPVKAKGGKVRCWTDVEVRRTTYRDGKQVGKPVVLKLQPRQPKRKGSSRSAFAGE